MGFLSVLSFAHKLIQERLQPGDAAVDATVGNGVDTAFLARLVGPSGAVHGFDIQEAALEAARSRLAAEIPAPKRPPVHLHLRSHDEMRAALPEALLGRAAAVMFNLGYWPSGSRGIITRPQTTLPALEAAADVLRTGGVLTIAVYPGHPGGGEEAEAVERWASGLPQERFQVLSYRFLNPRNPPPYIIAVEKKEPRRAEAD